METYQAYGFVQQNPQGSDDNDYMELNEFQASGTDSVKVQDPVSGKTTTKTGEKAQTKYRGFNIVLAIVIVAIYTSYSCDSYHCISSTDKQLQPVMGTRTVLEL